ncbi:MAG: polysaccharide deacetylase [Clostridia bacterium]|nr:polysaccharide deacetylase [Clostridia bacterium]
MKKQISLIALLCVVLSVFAACGGGSVKPADTLPHGGFIIDLPDNVVIPTTVPFSEAVSAAAAMPSTEPAEPPETSPSEETTYYTPDHKVIYITFDDGPGPYTERLLNIISAHPGVHVTFFVTHMHTQYSDILTREANDGHSIGVHSYTHDYDQIYRSSEAFWDDFTKMQTEIKAKTGIVTEISRFPGGSSNTVSNYNPGIMTQLAEEIHERGYEYFDWNVLSGDAGDTTSTSVVLDNMKRGVMGVEYPVVLCHDIKDFTIDAIDDFLTWGEENGYTFEGLTKDCFPAHHHINN